MTLAVRANIDTLRTVAHGSISGSYVAIGTQLLFPARMFCITNNTDGDMFISTDGVNDMLFVAATSFKLYDVTTNHQVASNQFTVASNTQFYVRQSSAPTKGAVYLEVIYGLPQGPAPNLL